MKIKDINQALKLFEDATRKQVEASRNGDYKTGNKNYHIIMKAAEYLKNNNSLDCLKPYLNSEILAEQLWSSFLLLRVDEYNAIKVLETISLGNDIIAGIAETTLNEWRKGNITW